MVAYGPWVEEDDYTSSPSVTVADQLAKFGDLGPFNGYEKRLASTGSSPIPISEVAEALRKARDDAPDGGDLLTQFGAWHGWHWEGSVGNLDGYAVGAYWFGQFALHPQMANQTFYPSSEPDGILGWEWQDPTLADDPTDPWSGASAAYLGVELLPTTRMVGIAGDRSRISTGEDLAQSWATEIRVQPQSEVGVGMFRRRAELETVATSVDGFTVMGEAARTLDGDPVDLSVALGPDGIGWIYTYTPTFVTPKGDPNDVNLSGVEAVEYGWKLDRLVTRWTFKPPTYRFIYAAEPYRRIFPRDDGLAGGSPRTYPVSKGVQSSNRIVGGYL